MWDDGVMGLPGGKGNLSQRQTQQSPPGSASRNRGADLGSGKHARREVRSLEHAGGRQQARGEYWKLFK